MEQVLARALGDLLTHICIKPKSSYISPWKNAKNCSDGIFKYNFWNLGIQPGGLPYRQPHNIKIISYMFGDATVHASYLSYNIQRIKLIGLCARNTYSSDQRRLALIQMATLIVTYAIFWMTNNNHFYTNVCYVLCCFIYVYICVFMHMYFVRNDEIKMFNQSLFKQAKWSSLSHKTGWKSNDKKWHIWPWFDITGHNTNI